VPFIPNAPESNVMNEFREETETHSPLTCGDVFEVRTSCLSGFAICEA